MALTAAPPWPRWLMSTLSEASDWELVKLTRKGNAEAFSELVRRHQSVVYNLAFRYMRDVALAEDMAQEAFLKAYRLLKGFRGDCRFSTWMYRVTSSVCLTELNRRKRRNEVELQPAHGGEVENGHIEADDMAELVRRCVTRLPERYAAIVTLYYLEQMPYEQIAEIMEIPLGTLKTWMFRARKELRAIVEKELNARGPKRV